MAGAEARAAEALPALEERLGHRFRDPRLLARALTHASVAAGEGEGDATYERLEFLGDSVLGLAVTDMLVRAFPAAPEGELSRRRARLVSGETCAAVAAGIGVDAHLRLGDETLRVNRRAAMGLLADVCEALIGALYRDGGMEAARAFVERHWRDRMLGMTGPLRDAKTELQEWAHRRGLGTPRYEEVGRAGPDHAPRFEIAVVIEGMEAARAAGASKREAEHDAAAAVLRREGVWVS